MRILTVKQPWAHAIIHGGKDVENRLRNLAGDYRGPVAIHAGKIRDDRGWVESESYKLTTSMHYGHPDALGAIIGTVNLVGVHQCDVFAECPPGTDDNSPWAQREWNMWHLELRRPRALRKPIPFTGALGLRWLEPDMIAQIEAQLGDN